MSNNNDNGANEGRPRRGSITAQTFTNIFARSNSTSGGPPSPFPGPITTAAAQDQRRRMSISTLGLSGTSPTQGAAFPFGRRGSVSTSNSEGIDESAIDDDDGPGRSAPTTPFTRRMSFGAQALRGARGGGGSPGTSAEGSGFNWSEQLRTRAESSVSQSQRPSFSTAFSAKSQAQDRKSITEMPAPPAVIPPPQPTRPERKKPDEFQERILKGDFYIS